MKKILVAAACVAALSLASCSSINNTAYTEEVNTELYNRSYADLNVSDKVISYTYQCDNGHSKAGLKSAKAAAVMAALEANGGGDLIVNPQFEYKIRSGKILYVTVKGHVATYKNVHNMTQAEADVYKTLKGCFKK